MSTTLYPDEERWSRVIAAAEIAGLAVDRGLPHMAVGAAREAARSALLALAMIPRHFPDADFDLLRSMAVAPSQRVGDHAAERMAMVLTTLQVVDRLFPRPDADRSLWHAPSPGVRP